MIIRSKNLSRYEPINTKNLTEFIQSYESIFRFSRSRLIHPETLMQHIAEVAIIALFIMDNINEQWDKCSPWDANMHQALFSEDEIACVLRRALVHDLEEIITGDIARPTKYSNNDLAYMIKELEAKAAEDVITNYKLPKEWKSAWANAKEDGELGLIIKVADCLSVVLTCYREINLYSNNHFKPVAAEVISYITELKEQFKDIREEAFLEKAYERHFILSTLLDVLESALDLLMEER